MSNHLPRPSADPDRLALTEAAPLVSIGHPWVQLVDTFDDTRLETAALTITKQAA